MQLTQWEFGYTVQGNKISLETKKDMKSRLGGAAASPDIADALACTFAQDVAPRSLMEFNFANFKVTIKISPLQRFVSSIRGYF